MPEARKKTTRKRKTIKFSDLKRLSFANSKDLPRVVKVQVGRGFVFKEWVGIGWVDIDTPADPNAVPELIDD